MNKNIISKITSVAILGTLVSYSVPVFAFTKDETVYSKVNSDGNTYSTIVSDHIKNAEQEQLINDISDLLNIENVKGDEEFTKKGDNVIWSANGNDIYYQGESQKELPVQCNIKYELDGEEISAEELAGKSGKVKITIEYINKEEHVVNINGKYEKLYTPFVVMCGTILDNETHKNIEITNGKLIDNGDKTVVVGISLPGMQESLNISKDKMEIPNTVEITMDATDFELNNIVTYITPKVFEKSDLEVFDKIDEIYGQISTLQNASTQLVDGSTQLRDGTIQLRSGIREFSNTLNGKINTYENARAQLSNKEVIESKMIEMVNAEIKKLAPELEALATEEASNVIRANKEEIEEKTADTALKYTQIAVQSELENIENGNTTIEIPEELLNTIENDIKIALENVLNKQDVQQLETAIKTAIINDVKTTVKDTTKATIENQVSALKNVDPTQLLSSSDKATLSALQDTIKQGLMAKNTALTEAQAEEQAKQYVNGLVKNVMNTTLDTVASKAPDMAVGAVDQIVASLNTDEAIAKAISDFKNRIVTEITQNVSEETLKAMEANIKKEIIEELEKSFKNDKELQQLMMKEGANVKNQLNLAIDSVAEKSAQDLAQDLSEKLANQIATNLIKKELNGELSETELDKELSKYENVINSELVEVDGQIDLLKNALNQLDNGADKLAVGATTLSEGMTTFDQEGIAKICNLVNGNLNDLTTRAEKLQELSKEYNNFTMINDDDEGEVKFIMIIDSIKKSEEDKQEVILEDKTKNK